MNYSDLPTAEVGASQFIGNSLKNSAVFLVLHSLQGQESWFPRPKSFSCNIYLISLVFAYGIDGQDIEDFTRKSWGFVIHPEFVFTK